MNIVIGSLEPRKVRYEFIVDTSGAFFYHLISPDSNVNGPGDFITFCPMKRRSVLFFRIPFSTFFDFSLRIRNVEAFSRFGTIKNLPSGVSPYGFQFRRNDALQFSTPNHQNGAVHTAKFFALFSTR